MIKRVHFLVAHFYQISDNLKFAGVFKIKENPIYMFY